MRALRAKELNMSRRRNPVLDARRVENPRTERFSMMMTPDERVVLEEVAAADHLTPSAWLRRAFLLARKAGV